MAKVCAPLQDPTLKKVRSDPIPAIAQLSLRSLSGSASFNLTGRRMSMRFKFRHYTSHMALASLMLFVGGCKSIVLDMAPVATGAEPSQTAQAPKPKAVVVPPTETKTGSAKVLTPEETVSMITPLVEKRETLMATGYAVISVQNHKNEAQQRLMAIRASKLDAYRALTEQVYGQQLDASTTVADMTIMNDTFRTKVEGVIYGAVLVSIAPVGDDTYETTLSLDKQVVKDLRTLYLGQLAARR
jgi:hypothetical protein